jgi:hypothetical protein
VCHPDTGSTLFHLMLCRLVTPWGISLPGRRALPSLLCAFALLSCTSALGQGAKVTALSEPITEKDSDHPREREQWFMRGRTVLGQSAAALRYKAHQQKIKMRAKRAAIMKAQSAVTPLASSSAGWTPLGPAPLSSDASGVGTQDYGFVSGRATSVAVDPADQTGNTVFIGGAYGGVWKSINAGPLSPNSTNVIWTSVSDNQPSLAVGAIAIQPGNTNPANSVVLVGTGEANNSADSYYGVGILRSVNGGSTWTTISSADNGAHLFLGLGFTKIAFSIANPNLVVAASAASSVGVDSGAISSSTRGLYTSTDGGQSWTLHVPVDGNGLAISPAASATAVVFNSVTKVFYAAIRYHGFYSSPDGITWTRLVNQPGGSNLTSTACPTALATTPTCPIYRGELAVVPGRNEMYVWYVDVNENDQGIWQTTNGGTSWTQINDSGITNCGNTDGGCGTQQGAYNLELAAVPNGPTGTDLYAGAINIFKCSINSNNPNCSTNAFINLTHVYGCNPIAASSHVHPDQHGVAFMLAGNPVKDLMYFANDGGVYRALDGFSGLTSGSCSPANLFDNLNQNLGSMTQFVTFSIDPTDPNTLLGGTQDNGSPATSTALTSTSWGNVLSGDGGYNAIDPSATSNWFASNPDVPPGQLNIQECSSGVACHTQSFTPLVTSSNVGGDDGSFYFPYILDPQSTTALLVGTCRVWRGPRLGGTYSLLSNNFDTGSSASCTGAEVNLVRALAAGGPPDANGSKVIYATTEGPGPLQGTPPVPGGHVFVTTSASTTLLSDVTNHGPGNTSINPSQYVVSSVAIDPSDATGNTAYVTIMGFRVSHVWKTTNAGASWTDLTGTGLPEAPVNAVVVDPTTSTVYVGTDVGVFSSSTATGNWTEVGPAPGLGTSGFLPNVPVTALRMFHSGGTRLLRASTYGRGVWQFNLAPYGITISNSPQTIFPGQSATFDGTLTSFNNYNSVVTLSCTNGATPPPATCNLNPQQATPTAAGASFMVTASDSTAKDYLFNIHGLGADGSVNDASVVLHVVDFSIAPPNPSSIDVVPGFQSQPVQIQVAGVGAFNGTVSLSCTAGLPAGASCTFDNPSPTVTPSAPVNVNLTINTPNSTPLGTATVTISASTAGAPAAKTQQLTMNVKSSGFSLVISNPALAALDGQTATYNGTITPLSGYSSKINVACAGGTRPSTCTPSQTSVTPNGTAPLSLSVNASNGVPGNFAFSIQAIGTDANTFTQNYPVSLSVTQDFTLGASPSMQTLKAGQSASYTLTVSPAGKAFNNAISFNCSGAGMPLGVSCSFSPPQVTPDANAVTSTLTITTSGPNATVIRPHATKRSPWPVVLWPTALGIVIGGLACSPKGRPKGASILSLILILVPTILLPSCGGGSGGGGGNGGGGGTISVSISPQSPTVFTTMTQQFTATVAGTSDTLVTWEVNGVSGGGLGTGTINSSGLYTAPAAPGVDTVAAVSQADSTKVATTSVTVKALTPSGTYPITVTASSGSLSHSVSVTLTVQ